jgi:hypothetical protein
LPTHSREHRMRVLENQAKMAAKTSASDREERDPQQKIPLIVEVKRGASMKQRAKRAHRKGGVDQPDLGEL